MRPGIGTVQTIVYFGPSFPEGRPGSIGSGCWPTAAGKNPVSIVSRPSGELSKSCFIFSVLLKPGPLIEASDGSFASAAVGISNAAPTTAASTNRFMGAPFCHRTYTGTPAAVPV